MFLRQEEGRGVTELQPQLKSYVDTMLAQWITSGGVEEGWDSYIEQLNSMGLQEYIAQFQAAMDRYNAQQ